MFDWFRKLINKHEQPVRIIAANPPRMYVHFDGMDRLVQKGREEEARAILSDIRKAQRQKKKHRHLLEQLRALEVK